MQESWLARACGVQSGLLAAMPLNTEVLDELDVLIQQAEKKGIVKGAQQIMGYLAKTGLMVSQQIPAEQVGCHPLNRDGYGVNPRDVHSLVSGIASVGFDAGQTHPICTEILPSDTELVSFNQALADGSNGLLPPMANCMRYASLANSHTNAALRCILASVPHDDPDLCTHGHLSLDVIRQKDPGLALAAEQGLVWRVISLQVAEARPQLLSIIQASSNTAGQLQRGEHESQMMRRIRNAVFGPSKGKKWHEIKGELQRSKPQCAEAMPHIYAFIVKFAGPTGLLDRTEDYIRAHAPSSRQLGAAFFDQLSMERRPASSDPWVFFRHACMRVGYTTDVHITATDIKRMFGRQCADKVEKANAIMRRMHELTSELEQRSIWQALGWFHQDVVMQALEKRQKDFDVSSTFEEAAARCIHEIQQVTSNKLTSEWDRWMVSDAVPAASTGTSTDVALHHVKTNTLCMPLSLNQSID